MWHLLGNSLRDCVMNIFVRLLMRLFVNWIELLREKVAPMSVNWTSSWRSFASFFSSSSLLSIVKHAAAFSSSPSSCICLLLLSAIHYGKIIFFPPLFLVTCTAVGLNRMLATAITNRQTGRRPQCSGNPWGWWMEGGNNECSRWEGRWPFTTIIIIVIIIISWNYYYCYY